MARSLVYMFGLMTFAVMLADPDLWGHIKFGEDIWMNGEVHQSDPYSYTAFGNTWINHEWLTEVLFYLLYRTFDTPGLVFFKVVIGLFILHALSSFYFSKSRNYTAYLIYFCLMIPVLHPGFMTRPQLMTFLFMTLFILILQRSLDDRPKLLAWMPLLFLLWVNCHGGVVAGLGMFGMVTFIEWVRGFFQKDTRRKALVTYFLISCAAVMINPFGYKLWLFFAESLTVPRNITEWYPIPLLDFSFWEYKVLALLFLASLLVPGKKRIWEISLVGFTVFYGFKHQRHAVLAVILMATYLPIQMAVWLEKMDLTALWKKLSNVPRKAVYATVVLFIACQLYLLGGKVADTQGKVVTEPQMYPIYAAQFMESNQIQGNLVVPFIWGEYMIWKFPESKVSIDGRFRTVYSKKVLDLSQAFLMGYPEGNALLTDYPTDYVLTSIREPSHKAMESVSGWVKIYQDPVSKLFIRKTDPPHPVLEKFYNNELVQPAERPPYTFPG